MPPRRRPPRRKRSTRPPLPQPQAVAAPTVAPSLPEEPAPAAPAPAGPVLVRAPEAARERSATTFTSRDYYYVRRELRRIAILATAIIIAIVVISLFVA